MATFGSEGSASGLRQRVGTTATTATTASATSTASQKEDKEAELPLGVYLSWIKKEIGEEEACLELPFSITLLLSFCVLAMMHLKQSRIYSVESAIQFDIVENANFAWSHNFGHKSIADVNNIPDFWSWYRLGFLPLIVQQQWGWSESLPEAYASTAAALNFSDEFSTDYLEPQLEFEPFGENSTVPMRDDYLHHNRIIGGIRVRQERSARSWDSCRFPSNIDESLWRPYLGKPCLPGNNRYELMPEVDMAEAFDDPQRVEWFLTARYSLAELMSKSVDMEDGCQQLEAKGKSECNCSTCFAEEVGGMTPWFDEQTQRVQLAFVSFNAEYGLVSLTSVDFFVGRGGMILKFVHVQSAWLDQLAGEFFEVVPMLFFDVVWFTLLNYVLIVEVREISKTIQASKQMWYRSIWEDYIRFWNMVDWVSIMVAYYVVTMFILLVVRGMGVTESMTDIVRQAPSADNDEYIQLTVRFVTEVESMCAQERGYRFAFCFYPMVMMLRLFKSFHAQPRLAIVTRTMKGAAQDMGHFGLVFSSVFFCMVANSILIFGQDIEGFTDFQRALHTCFRVMFGDWDWDVMTEVGLGFAAMWFWLFIVIMVQILLNFLLAILMEAYAEIKAEGANDESLWQQLCEIVRRSRQFKQGKRLRLNDIWDAFFEQFKDEKAMCSNEDIVKPSDLVRRVKGLKISQAKRTLGNAKQEKEDGEELPFDADEANLQMKVLSQRAKLMERESHAVRAVIEKYDYDERWAAENEPEPYLDPRAEVAEAVREVVGRLGPQVGLVLEEEQRGFDQRHSALERQHREMLACAKDSHRTLQSLRTQTDQAMRTLQRAAMLHRRRIAEQARATEARGSSGGNVFGFDACCVTAQEAPTRLVR